MSYGMDNLGRRAVACRHWRWLAGMLAVVPPADDGGTGYYARVTEGTGPINSARAFPDLTDSATVGCLLFLVREAWNELELSATYYDDGTWCVGWPDNLRHRQPSEAAALVAALEAAP